MLRQQSTRLLSLSPGETEQVLHQCMTDTAAWFELDRISLIASNDASNVIGYQRAGIPAISKSWSQKEIQSYLSYLPDAESGLAFDFAQHQSHGLEHLAMQGVRKHWLKAIVVHGQLWGVVSYCRFTDDASTLTEKNHNQLQLLGEMWTGAWMLAKRDALHKVEAQLATMNNSPDPCAALSARQLEVIRLLASGLTAKECSTRLGISRRTVESHKYRIMDQLNLDTNADLVRFALSRGITAS